MGFPRNPPFLPGVILDVPLGVLIASQADVLASAGPALTALMSACQDGSNTGPKTRDFADEIRQLLSVGLPEGDLRWLVCKACLQHADQRAREENGDGAFSPEGEPPLTGRECFVLIPDVDGLSGETLARLVATGRASWHSTFRQKEGPVAAGQPAWDAGRRELRVGDVVVKRFCLPAHNQEAVLSAFQEEGWPARIDDPLPPRLHCHPKARLHDTIKCLNRHQQHRLIHFGGDGSGEGILWEFIASSGDASH